MNFETVKDALILVSIINFAALLIVNCIWLYIAKTKIRLIMRSLKNSPIRYSLMMLWHGGMWGRIYMMGEISRFLKRPEIHIYHERLSAEDIKKFPPDFKRTLLTLHKCQLFSGITFFALGALGVLNII